MRFVAESVNNNGSKLVIEVLGAGLFSQVAVPGVVLSLKVTLNVCRLAINIALPDAQLSPIVGSPARAPKLVAEFAPNGLEAGAG